MHTIFASAEIRQFAPLLCILLTVLRHPFERVEYRRSLACSFTNPDIITKDSVVGAFVDAFSDGKEMGDLSLLKSGQRLRLGWFVELQY